jgi:hypothetical protein
VRARGARRPTPHPIGGGRWERSRR